MNRLVIAKGNQRQLTYYWYQSRGRVIAEDYMKMVHLFWDRATKSRTDGSLVRLTVEMYRQRRGDRRGGSSRGGLPGGSAAPPLRARVARDGPIEERRHPSHVVTNVGFGFDDRAILPERPLAERPIIDGAT